MYEVCLKLANWFLRRRFFLISSILFSLFSKYFPLEKGGFFLLNKLEFPLPKNAMCQVWLKLTQWFWRRRILNFVHVFWLFCYHLPLEKGVTLHWKKFKSPLPKDGLCQVCLKFAHWFWRRTRKSEK